MKDEGRRCRRKKERGPGRREIIVAVEGRSAAGGEMLYGETLGRAALAGTGLGLRRRDTGALVLGIG